MGPNSHRAHPSKSPPSIQKPIAERHCETSRKVVDRSEPQVNPGDRIASKNGKIEHLGSEADRGGISERVDFPKRRRKRKQMNPCSSTSSQLTRKALLKVTGFSDPNPD
ncbi:hypothetical protein FNV43_RR22681 [Rhamnella rubrinervis]|uniref:Uncharacterized protein n=1 Tax=Rhamnella rubrinervis TaxID=2594499 RepID=A0A8K0DQW7_9ROSA|nr:hypothetical protein FNV43_RR22681 [Rhamnella rubrinervis]